MRVWPNQFLFKMSIITRLIFLVLFLVTSLPVMAQKADTSTYRWINDIGHSTWDLALTSEEHTQLLQLWESIGDDLRKSPHPLAGTYVLLSHNSGYFLRWSPNSGFIVIPYFDQNLITEFGYGRVSVIDGYDVEFTSVRHLKGGRGLPRMPERWTSILGYFVPTNELNEFARFRAGLGEYNEFNGSCCDFIPTFLCKRLEEEKPLSLTIPAKYAGIFLQPIKGRITSVGRRKTVKDWSYQGTLHEQWMEKAVLIPVTINAGRAAGVKRNMLFRMIGEPASYQYLQVIRVKQRQSFGYIVRDISDGKETYVDSSTNQEKVLPPIRIGIQVTTSPIPQ